MKTSKRILSFVYSIGAVLLVFIFTNAGAQICSVNAGLDKTICITQQPLTLNGTVGSSQSLPPVYVWTKLAGPSATITSPYQLTTTVTGLTPGNYVFQISNKCIDGFFAKDIVSITVLPEPATAIAGPDMNFCYNAPIRLAANAIDAPNMGTWAVLPVGGTFSPTANDPHAIYTGPTNPGIKRFIWTVSNGACQTSDTMRVSIAEPVTPVSAGTDTTLYCKGKCLVLNGSYPGFAPQNGLWTIVSAPNIPIFSDAANPNCKVCNLVPGIYRLRWTVSGPCVNGSDDMVIDVVNIKSIPPTLGDQSYTGFCETPAVRTEVLTGAPVAPGDSVTWTQIGGSSIATFFPDNHHATVSADNMTGAFPYKFNYIYNSASGCNLITTHTVYRSQLITGLTNPPDQELSCDVTGTTFDISFNKLNPASNIIVRKSVLVSGPADSGRILISRSVTTGLITTDTWTISNLTVPGTYIYRLEYSNSCGSSFRDISVTVSRTPGTVNAGSDIILPCQSLSVGPVGSVNAPGIYTWAQVAGPGTAVITGEGTLGPLLSGLSQGVYTIQLSNWGGNACPVKTGNMNIMVTQLPPAIAIAGYDTTICAGNYQLTANPVLPAETGAWTVVPSAGISFYPDSTAANAFVSGLEQNSIYNFTWTVSNVCGSVSATQVLTTSTFFSSPIPEAGEDICADPGTISFPLVGNDPLAANVLWTALTPGSEVQPADQQNTQAIFSNGSNIYLFEYALNTPGCAIFKDTVKVTVRNTVIINAGPDINICAASLPAAATLHATFSPAENFPAVWTQLSGPSTVIIASANDPNTGITNLRAGTYQFEYRIIPGSECEFISDTIVVNVFESPADAIAGPDKSVCSISPGTMILLSATDPFAGTGYWQVMSGPPGCPTPVFTNQGSAMAGISNLTQGMYHLLWTVTNGAGCPAKTDDMFINVNAAANAGPDLSACNSTTIQLTGSSNTIGTWSFVSGPAGSVIAANSGNTAIVSGLVTAAVPVVYKFRYSLPAIGGCAASSDMLIFTNYAPPSPAIAGADKVLCFDETTVTLTGGSPLTGKASWLWQSGPNTPTAGTSNNTSIDTTLNNLIPGIYVYQYRVTTNPACISSTENIQIIKQAKANAQADIRICNVSTVNLNAAVPLPGQGTWSYISGPAAPGTIVFSNVNNPASSVTGLIPGTYVFRWSLPATASCIASDDDIEVIIDPAVSAENAGTNHEFCQGTVTPFSLGAGHGYPGVSYTWSPATLLSNANISQPVFEGVNNAGMYVYTLKASIGTCESFSTVSIHVKPTPFANIEVTGSGCSGTFLASSPGNNVNNPLFNWSFGNNASPAFASGQGPQIISFGNSGTHNISLDISSSDGCVNATSMDYYSFCVLPVNLISFDAIWKNNATEISWEVENAINFSHFELERSIDGRSFSLLNKRDYINGQKKYGYTDKTMNGTNSEIFYRLKMIDIDSRFSYSPVKTIKFGQQAAYNIWPNPFNDKIIVKYNSQYTHGNIFIKIYNAVGAMLVNRKMNVNQVDNSVEIDSLANLPTGLYTVQIISEGKIINNYKLIKRNL